MGDPSADGMEVARRLRASLRLGVVHAPVGGAQQIGEVGGRYMYAGIRTCTDAEADTGEGKAVQLEVVVYRLELFHQLFARRLVAIGQDGELVATKAEAVKLA